MKKSVLFLILFCSINLFAQKVTNVWTGAVSPDWHKSSNWSLGHIPLISEDVEIPYGMSYDPIIEGQDASMKNALVHAGVILRVDNVDVNVGHLLLVYGQIRFLSSTADIFCQDLKWRSGSYLHDAFGGKFYLSGDLEFSAGADIQMDNTYLEFVGSGTNSIISSDAGSLIGSLSVFKTGGTIEISSATTADITVLRSVSLAGSGYFFECNADISVNIGWRFTNDAAEIRLDHGTVNMTKTPGIFDYYIKPRPGDNFNNLTIDSEDVTYVLDNTHTSVLEIMGTLSINSGALDASDMDLQVGGNWQNNIGPDAFIEGTRLVTFNGNSNIQSCSNEIFYDLALDNGGGSITLDGSNVSCMSYSWIAGTMKVLAGGNFEADDLAGYGIDGGWYIDESTVTLTQTDGYVDLTGEVEINNGEMLIYGGIDDSWWPGDAEASVTLNDGNIWLMDVGLWIKSGNTLNQNIDGNILIAGNLQISREDFIAPDATFEMMGGSDTQIAIDDGYFGRLVINKEEAETGKSTSSIYYKGFTSRNGFVTTPGRSNNVSLSTDLNIYSCQLQSGTLELNGHALSTMSFEASKTGEVSTLLMNDPADLLQVLLNLRWYAGATANCNDGTFQIDGSWYTEDGTEIYLFADNQVIFSGGLDRSLTVYDADGNFAQLIIDKDIASLSIFGDVTCQEYNWENGKIVVNGYFRAEDLSDNGVFGEYELYSGQIHLTQDDYHYADLNADIKIHDGEFLIEGGSGPSYIAYSADAEIQMDDGVLDFRNNGIHIADWGNNFTTNITGGLLRTDQSLYCYTGDFTPAGGAIEFYGGTNAEVMFTETLLLPELIMSKSGGDDATQNLRLRDGTTRKITRGNSLIMEDTLGAGYLHLQSGKMNTNGYFLGIDDSIAIDNGATLLANSDIMFLPTKSDVHARIYNGGQLTMHEGSSMSWFNIFVESGGTISAGGATFHQPGSNGIVIHSGGVIDPEFSFTGCTFDDVLASQSFLAINNAQDVVIDNATFNKADPTIGVSITKTADQGTVTVTNYSGNATGPDFEDDPYNRIQWNNPVPGLWSGAVSTDWHTPGNWDDGSIPTFMDDVVIPAGCPNYPVLTGLQANCANLEVQNGTSFEIVDLNMYVGETVDISGEFVMNHPDGLLNTMSISWLNGATSDVTAGTIEVHDGIAFLPGSNIQFGAVNTLRLTGVFPATGILVDEPLTSLGSITVDKTSGAGEIATGTTEQVIMTGTLSILANNEFRVNQHEMIIDSLSLPENATLKLSSTDGPGYCRVNNNFNHYGEIITDFADKSKAVHSGAFEVFGDYYLDEAGLLEMTEGGTFHQHNPVYQTLIYGEMELSNGALFETEGSLHFFEQASIHGNDCNFMINMNLWVEASADFNMTSGTFEFFGDAPTTITINNKHFHNLLINKSPGSIAYINTFTEVRNNFTLNSGVFRLTYGPTFANMSVAGDWTNNSSPGSFISGAGTVTFTGTGNSTITTNETFYNLVVDKPDPTIGFLILDDGVTVNVENDLQILDGTLEMNDNSTLDVNHDLTIEADAGLNAFGDTGLEIYLAGNWLNYNATYDDHVGFNPGTSTIVFDGLEEEQEMVTVAAYEEFYNLIIDKTGGIGTYSVNLDENIRVLNNLHLVHGFWHAFSSTDHEILGDITVEPDGFFSNLNASLTLTGSQNQNVWTEGQFNTASLIILKTGPENQVNAHGYFSVNECTVEEGSASFDFSRIYNVETLSVHDGGTLMLTDSCFLDMEPGGVIDVYNGGYLGLNGSEEKEVNVHADADGRYSFTVLAGGQLAAEHANFTDLDAEGIVIEPGAAIDPDLAFNHTHFGWGIPGGKYLAINNGQTLYINDITFLNSDWDMEANISKINDLGEVFITSHAGNFSGEAFDQDPFDRIHWENGPEQHLIPISEGWSGISSYIEPMNLSLGDMFGQLDEFVIAYNQLGIFYPAYNINTMGSWPIKGVFVVKNEEEETLIVNGYPDEDKTIMVQGNWTLIPVVSRCPVDIEDIFASHLDDLLLVKEVAGYRVYWPQMGINTIGTMEPGKAYYALASNAFSYTYANCDKEASAEKAPEDSESGKNLTKYENLLSVANWNVPVKTPVTHSIAISKEAVQGFVPGSIIGVFNQERQCFGYVNPDGKQTCLTAFGKNPFSNDQAGFSANEPMYFQLYLPSTDESYEIIPEYNHSLPHHDGVFVENGLSLITGFKAGNTGMINDWGENVRIYPNPSNGIFNISGLPAGAEINITDVHGQLVFSGLSSSGIQQRIDLQKCNSGIYMIGISRHGNSSYHKMVVR